MMSKIFSKKFEKIEFRKSTKKSEGMLYYKSDMWGLASKGFHWKFKFLSFTQVFRILFIQFYGLFGCITILIFIWSHTIRGF